MNFFFFLFLFAVFVSSSNMTHESASRIGAVIMDGDNNQLGVVALTRSTLIKTSKGTCYLPLHPLKGSKWIQGCIKLGWETTANSNQTLEVLRRMAPLNPSQTQFRKQEKISSVKRKHVGDIKISYAYHPPFGRGLGAFEVTVIGCSGLITADKNGKPNTYVCLELCYDGNRHCFLRWGSKNNAGKPQKPSKQSQLESIGSVTRTSTKDGTRDPQFQQSFVLPVHPHSEFEPFFLDINVWQFDCSSDHHIGSARIAEPDMKPSTRTEVTLGLAGVLSEGDFPKKIGASLAEIGFKPKHPIVLVPGFCSSSLVVNEGDPSWQGERIWLSMTRLTQETKMARAIRMQSPLKRSSSATVSSESDREVEEWQHESDSDYKNRWIAHMCLSEDGCTDPKAISVRPVSGVSGCAYLTPGRLTNALSYVMGPLIEDLLDLGYEEGKNLFAASYDWRLPPHFMEQRDHFFSNMAQAIEQLVKENGGNGVVLVPHSMGCRTAQYFLTFAEAHYGRDWIDKHIHLFLALGGPFLGAPKSIRGLCSGERLGLEAFLSEDDGLALARRIGSTQFLFPVGCKHYFDPALHQDSSFLYLKDENSEEFVSKPCDTALVESGCSVQLEQFNDYYMKNPLFGGDHEGAVRAIHAPPCKRLVALYGVGLPTEVKYFYEKNKNGYFSLKSPKDTSRYGPFAIDKGMAYETDTTPSHVPRQLSGVVECKSGDGTVPYASLAWPYQWRSQMEFLEVIELYGAEHREMLANRALWHYVAHFACEQDPVAPVSSDKASVHVWRESSLKSPTYCRACGELIFGNFKACMQCNLCEMNCHFECYKEIPEKSCAPKETLRNRILEHHKKMEEKRKTFHTRLEEQRQNRRKIINDRTCKIDEEIQNFRHEVKEKREEVKGKIKGFFGKKDKKE